MLARAVKLHLIKVGKRQGLLHIKHLLPHKGIFLGLTMPARKLLPVCIPFVSTRTHLWNVLQAHRKILFECLYAASPYSAAEQFHN